MNRPPRGWTRAAQRAGGHATSAVRWYLAGLMTLGGCTGATGIDTPPPPPTVEPATLTVRADPEDLTVATALGWADGLPGVQVRLQSAPPGSSVQTLVSSADGTVSLIGLMPGDYTVDITRWLTPAERGLVPAGDRTAGFAIRKTIRLGASTEFEIAVPASRRTGLVISEWSFASIYTPSAGSYSFGGYLELYNNGDTTAYVDGLLVGEAYTQAVDYPAPTQNPSCAAAATFTNDPSGLWVRQMVRFPGSGTQYAVPPGGLVVIATDAIDHRPLTPGGVDLSHADFELIGSQDVDNPAVPNMLDVGLFPGFFGHGIEFDIAHSVPFLAKSVEPSTLLRRTAAYRNDLVLMKIETPDVLDAAALLAVFDFLGFPLCPRLVSPAIDRETARVIVNVDYLTEPITSVHRIMPAGQSFLQDTRSSGSDMIAAPRTPGTVP